MQHLDPITERRLRLDMVFLNRSVPNRVPWPVYTIAKKLLKALEAERPGSPAYEANLAAWNAFFVQVRRDASPLWILERHGNMTKLGEIGASEGEELWSETRNQNCAPTSQGQTKQLTWIAAVLADLRDFASCNNEEDIAATLSDAHEKVSSAL